MVNAIRFGVIFIIVWMMGAPGAIALLQGFSHLYPSFAISVFFVVLLITGTIFGYSLKFNMTIAAVISGLLVESLACIIFLTQWHSGLLGPLIGIVIWIGAAIGITMCLDQIYMRRTNRLHG